MKYIYRTAFYLTLLAMFASSLHGQEANWVSIGPGGCTITSVIEDASDSSLLYITTKSSGFYKSTDGGESWIRKEDGLPLSRINNVVQNPDEPLRLYLGTERGVYKSIDRGESWTLASGTEMDTTLSFLIAIDPILPARLFAAGMTNGVFRSTNFGEAWTTVSAGLPPLNYADITVDPNVNTRAYASSEQQGMFRTILSGDFWQQEIEGLTNTNQRSFLAVPTTEDLIFTGTTSGGFFRSTSAGDLWSQVGANLPAVDISALAHLNSEPEMILAGTKGRGIYVSTDNGDSFTQFSDILSHHRINSLFTAGENRIYAGMEKDCLFMSGDGGQTWTYSFRGLSGGYISAMAISTEEPQYFYTGLSEGENDLLVSTDTGRSWELRHSGLPVFTGVYDFWLANNGQTVFACTDSGVFKTTDHGNSWVPKNSGLEGITTKIAGSQFDENLLFVISSGILKSTDGGESWDSTHTGVEGVPISILVSRTSPDTIYTGTKPVGEVGGGIYRSTDGGSSWHAASNGLERNEFVFSLAMDPADPRILFAATATGVFRSTNSGESWFPRMTGLPLDFSASDVIIDSFNHDRVFTSSLDYGVYISTDAAESWSGLNAGLDTLAVLEIEQDPINPDTMYAGTTGKGIYMIDLSPVGIEQETGEVNFPKTLSLEQNFPNPFNPSTTITIHVDAPGIDHSLKEKVSLRVYTLRGKPVRTLFEGALMPGVHTFNWDGKDENGVAVATGPYFIVLKKGKETVRKKMSLIR